MTRTILIESVAEQGDHDIGEISRNDDHSFVEGQHALPDPIGSVKIAPSRQLSLRLLPRRQESFESQLSFDSSGLRTMKRLGSTTSLASASTATGSPNSSPGSAYRGEEWSFGRCQLGRASTETCLLRSATMPENPQMGLSNEDELERSCTFAEWAMTAQKRCPDARLEPGVPRPVPRPWLHKVIETPSDERETQISSQARALSRLMPSTNSPRKHKHWMLRA